MEINYKVQGDGGGNTIRTLILCNHSIYNYMWLFVICNCILSFLQLFIIFLNLLLFLWLWWNYKITHPSILTNFLKFSSKNRPLCSFNHKIYCNLIIFYVNFIHLIHITLLWITLTMYLTCIQCILNIF